MSKDKLVIMDEYNSMPKELKQLAARCIDKDIANKLSKRYVLPEDIKKETHEERHILNNWSHVWNWITGYPNYKTAWIDPMQVCQNALFTERKILLIVRYHPIYGGFLSFKVWKETQK